MTDEGIRLAKQVAEIVPCSRAEAERYIAGGWVSVDGEVTEDPATRVGPNQQVALLPGAVPDEPLPVTILLHKPAGKDAFECLTLDAVFSAGQGGQRVLKRHLSKITLATPLESLASGLVVFSQDWRVLRKLVEDSNRIEQEYVAEVSGAIAEDGLARLNAERKGSNPVKASWQSEARLRFAGKGIVPGQVERLCGACAWAGLLCRTCRRASGAICRNTNVSERPRGGSATLGDGHHLRARQTVVQELAVLVEQRRQAPGRDAGRDRDADFRLAAQAKQRAHDQRRQEPPPGQQVAPCLARAAAGSASPRTCARSSSPACDRCWSSTRRNTRP
jgi:23S rRNA pseudouridine2604 synthase